MWSIQPPRAAAASDPTAALLPRGAAASSFAPLSVTPEHRLAHAGDLARFWVRIKYPGPISGQMDAKRVRLCLKAPKRFIRLPDRCRKYGTIVPGRAKSKRVKVRVLASAPVGRRIAIRFVASAATGQKSKGRATIRVIKVPGDG